MTDLPSIKDLKLLRTTIAVKGIDVLKRYVDMKDLRALGLLLAKHYQEKWREEMLKTIPDKRKAYCNQGARDGVLQAFGITKQEFTEWLKKEDDLK